MPRCPWAKGELYERYHDEEWGVPVRDDRVLFEFLILEGAQAGLSWSTILNKREHYREAFAGFDPEKIARYVSYAQMHPNSPDVIKRRERLEEFRKGPYITIPEPAWKKRFTSMTPDAVNDAGAVETSILMHLAPELVDERAGDHVPSADPIVLDSVPFAQVAPTGVWGRPSEASAEKGERALNAIVDATTDYIRRTFGQLERIKATGQGERGETP